MPRFDLFKGAVVALTALSLITPVQVVCADGSTGKTRSTARTAAMADVTLGESGALSGRVVDHTGAPIEGANVVVRQGKQELATVQTNDEGLFEVKNLSGGVYEVASGNTQGRFRLWNEKAAPPAAKGQALLVMGENGARGQFGAVDPTLVLLTAGVITAVVLSAVSLSQINDVQEDVDKINQTLGN